MDDSMPGVFGRISGIMQMIRTEARIALSDGDDYADNPAEAIKRYRHALDNIHTNADRAEMLWKAFMDREVPEHKEISGPERDTQTHT